MTTRMVSAALAAGLALGYGPAEADLDEDRFIAPVATPETAAERLRIQTPYRLLHDLNLRGREAAGSVGRGAPTAVEADDEMMAASAPLPMIPAGSLVVVLSRVDLDGLLHLMVDARMPDGSPGAGVVRGSDLVAAINL